MLTSSACGPIAAWPAISSASVLVSLVQGQEWSECCKDFRLGIPCFSDVYTYAFSLRAASSQNWKVFFYSFSHSTLSCSCSSHSCKSSAYCCKHSAYLTRRSKYRKPLSTDQLLGLLTSDCCRTSPRMERCPSSCACRQAAVQVPPQTGR